MHDPLEDWAEKDRLLAEIGVEPAEQAVAPLPLPAPRSAALGSPRVVRLAALDPPEEPAAPPPPAPPARPGRRRALSSVILLGVGVAWLAAGAGAGSGTASLAGLAFLAAGAAAAAPLLRS